MRGVIVDCLQVDAAEGQASATRMHEHLQRLSLATVAALPWDPRSTTSAPGLGSPLPHLHRDASPKATPLSTPAAADAAAPTTAELIASLELGMRAHAHELSEAQARSQLAFVRSESPRPPARAEARVGIPRQAPGSPPATSAPGRGSPHSHLQAFHSERLDAIVRDLRRAMAADLTSARADFARALAAQAAVTAEGSGGSGGQAERVALLEDHVAHLSQSVGRVRQLEESLVERIKCAVGVELLFCCGPFAGRPLV